jgi:hypothetical protein
MTPGTRTRDSWEGGAWRWMETHSTFVSLVCQHGCRRGGRGLGLQHPPGRMILDRLSPSNKVQLHQRRFQLLVGNKMVAHL